MIAATSTTAIRPPSAEREFSHPGEQHVDRGTVQTTFGDDDVGVPLARLDEALMGGLHGGEVLIDDALGGPAPFGDVAAAVSTKILRSNRSRRSRSHNTRIPSTTMIRAGSTMRTCPLRLSCA